MKNKIPHSLRRQILLNIKLRAAIKQTDELIDKLNKQL